MGQSLVNNYVHIIFSTKNRVQLIQEPYEEELHTYIAGTCKQLDCTPIKVGGHTDHIHILCLLSKNIALSKLIEEIKSHSSKWIKTKNTELKEFYWQNGYGAFSINPTEMNTVISYIHNQREHHSHKSFQEEYRGFLTKYKLYYDEQYIWD